MFHQVCYRGVFSANAVLHTRWTQFINQENYKIIDANFKIIDSNVMDWENVTKIHTPPSAKRYSISPPPPPHWRACAVQRQFRDREWRAVESHCWQRTGWWKCVVSVSWTLNINAWDANCLFAINAQCLKKTRTFRNGQPVKTLHTARLETGALWQLFFAFDTMYGINAHTRWGGRWGVLNTALPQKNRQIPYLTKTLTKINRIPKPLLRMFVKFLFVFEF